LIISSSLLTAQGVAINEDGTQANANAMLDVKSPATGNGQGILVPRLTEAQITINSTDGGLLNGSGELHGGAAQGLLVYQTDGCEGFYYNTSTTAIPNWKYIGLEDTLPIEDGGTGAATIKNAKINLELEKTKIIHDDEDSEIWIGDTINYSGANNIAIGYGARAGKGGGGATTPEGIAGIAIGKSATARYARGSTATSDCPFALNGIAIGTDSDGDYGGIAIGYDADGQYRNIAIGHKANAYSGYQRIAIGNGVINRHNQSIYLRGTLFLEDCAEITVDGQTGRIFYRSSGDPDGTADTENSMGSWTAKAFTIDHPLDPENKILRHFCVEGPDVLNIYSGNVFIKNGEATVTLPDYYSALNLVGSEVYSSMPIGGPTKVWIKEKVNGNQFVICADIDIEVSWTVKVKRNDEALLLDLENRPVEQLKNQLRSNQRSMENSTINTDMYKRHIEGVDD